MQTATVPVPIETQTGPIPAGIESESPLFPSAHHALRFALTRTGLPSKPLLNTLLPGGVPGRGLAGLDGAAQAGIILSVVRTLGELPLAVLTAGAAPMMLPCSCKRACCSGHRMNADWVGAVQIIVDQAVELKVCNAAGELRLALVLKIYGKRLTVSEIARKLDYSPEWVWRQHRMLHGWLMGSSRGGPQSESRLGLDPSSWGEAERVLRDWGIVG